MQHYYFNRLPHYTPITASYFITIRLYNSLPQKTFQLIKKTYEKEFREILKSDHTIENKEKLIEHLKSKYFTNFESQLDKQYGDCFLSQPKIAECVINKIKQHEIYSLLGLFGTGSSPVGPQG